MKRSRLPRQEQDILSEEANSNPYAPPGAVVADFQLDAASQVRPGTVSLAVRLLWIVCGLGALFILFKPLTLRPGASALWARLIALPVSFTVQTGLQLTTVVLLLLPSASRWFRLPSSSA